MAEGDDWTMGEVVRTLRRIEKHLDETPIRYVTRTEWVERNSVVNNALGDLRDHSRQGKATALAVCSMVIAAGGIVLGVIR